MNTSGIRKTFKVKEGLSNQWSQLIEGSVKLCSNCWKYWGENEQTSSEASTVFRIKTGCSIIHLNISVSGVFLSIMHLLEISCRQTLTSIKMNLCSFFRAFA